MYMDKNNLYSSFTELMHRSPSQSLEFLTRTVIYDDYDNDERKQLNRNTRPPYHGEFPKK